VYNRILLLLAGQRCSIFEPECVGGKAFMKPSEALASNRAAIRHVVESHRARNARVFGSVLRGQDSEGSDLDILVDPTAETTLMDVAAIQVELQRLLGVSVDVLTPKALPDKIRSVVLAEAVLV
jgi:predicted nucleotidyltransferase